MTAQDFCFWLQGFSEIGNVKPTEKQWEIIKDHLALVFDKKTPFYENFENYRYISGNPAEGIENIPFQSVPITC